MLKWEQRIWVARPDAVEKPCKACQRVMWLPPSKADQKATCSDACKAEARQREHDALVRACATCGANFRPRGVQVRAGGGRFCSQACNTAGLAALQAPDVQARAVSRLRAAYADGRLNKPSGHLSPSWKGGPEARKQRDRESGKTAAKTRAYRKANPDKVREFAQSRYRRTLGKLPAGTVERIGIAQRWKCGICRVSVRKRFHLDHVVPVALGGPHKSSNLQLLCPPCNRRKNAKDPIDYMRSLGRLL